MTIKTYTLSDVLMFAYNNGVEGTTDDKIRAYLDWKYSENNTSKESHKIGNRERRMAQVVVFSTNKSKKGIVISDPMVWNRNEMLSTAFTLAVKLNSGKTEGLDHFQVGFMETESLSDAMGEIKNTRGRKSKEENSKG